MRYCTVSVVVYTVHSCPSSAQNNWSIVYCFTSFLVAWSTARSSLDSSDNFLHFMDFPRANCVQAMVLLHV